MSLQQNVLFLESFSHPYLQVQHIIRSNLYRLYPIRELCTAENFIVKTITLSWCLKKLVGFARFPLNVCIDIFFLSWIVFFLFRYLFVQQLHHIFFFLKKIFQVKNPQLNSWQFSKLQIIIKISCLKMIHLMPNFPPLAHKIFRNNWQAGRQAGKLKIVITKMNMRRKFSDIRILMTSIFKTFNNGLLKSRACACVCVCVQRYVLPINWIEILQYLSLCLSLVYSECCCCCFCIWIVWRNK